MRKSTKYETRGPEYGFVSNGCINLKFNEYLIGVHRVCFVGGIGWVDPSAVVQIGVFEQVLGNLDLFKHGDCSGDHRNPMAEGTVA